MPPLLRPIKLHRFGLWLGHRSICAECSRWPDWKTEKCETSAQNDPLKQLNTNVPRRPGFSSHLSFLQAYHICTTRRRGLGRCWISQLIPCPQEALQVFLPLPQWNHLQPAKADMWLVVGRHPSYYHQPWQALFTLWCAIESAAPTFQSFSNKQKNKVSQL